ncbi:MAG: TIM-barrel domain-containing protein, partial [Verrucomicrobiota bacterium]
MRQYKNKASQANTIIFGNARFQFMTDRLLRMEYSSTGCFEDRATLTVVNRSFPAVKWHKEVKDNVLVLTTSALTLTYTDDGNVFSNDNLRIDFDCNGTRKCWHPGMDNNGNLGGTLRTLDGMEGNRKIKKVPNPDFIPNREGKKKTGAPGQSLTEFISVNEPVDLGSGLVSRAGWTIIDDTRSVVLDENNGYEWVAARRDGGDADLYFLGYGTDYKAALKDCANLLGRQPLPPRYAFGCWFSRYWAYTDQEIEEIVNAFDIADVPLDVIVVDMDWHLEGWTGYTWDKRYFPDPDEFLSEMHRRGLKVTLNLHPAEGVKKHEDQFKDMAVAMGLDPEKTNQVLFDITDPNYVKAYFDILHHPEERRGVDFWWMDWQQGESTKLTGLDPLPWINHLHWYDMVDNPDRKNKRPLIFSRWGGLGGGRHCIGFSGDTYSTWESLAFQ